ncbi:cation/calcium exchanger 5 [Cucurbita maxima]|uniref:Cation/calcium exchanger 5 n=1 Tax=Cucurbita maxima TaxID=3661 RepID=A0A6J1HVM3_CUCMA|nr:cation/calcium exchanger 5 [Cucurbita maxima]
MAISLSFLKSSALSLTILSVFIFFLLFTPNHSPESSSRRSLIAAGDSNSNASSIPYCSSRESHFDGLVNYLYFHFCSFDRNPFLSVPFLILILLLYFYILIKTAQDHFSIVTSKLAFHLNLSPSMAAVTLLALGNGAPDVFASVAAVRGGHYRTGFGAILSAGTFVSAFVVGFVAIYAAPFSVNPAQFVRDVLFYLTAALFLFYVYLSAEIFLWQAVGFVGFYLFFVGLVFWMDLGNGKAKSGADMGVAREAEGELPQDCEMGEGYRHVDEGKTNSGLWEALRMIPKAWEAPVVFLLKLTIPQPAPSEWSRFFTSANISLCPIALLYACNSFMSFNHPIAFLLPNTHLPLWFVVLLASSSLAILHFVTETEPPKTEKVPVVLAAFVMSVFWISTTAGELLNCLAALGVLLKLPAALLGLTVLAWGNSVGDLVADVALAKAGQPLLAMAGCFAGPMFNMLVGLGTALVIQTANNYPEAYQLQFHIGIVIAFVFLLFSLMGSLLVVIWCRFRVPRFWGFCLVVLYIVFMATSLLMAEYSP